MFRIFIVLTSLSFIAEDARAGSVSFNAEPAKDTFLLYEEIQLELEARNNTDVPFQHKPLTLGTGILRCTVIDESGTAHQVPVFHVSLAQNRLDTLSPGETIRNTVYIGGRHPAPEHDVDVRLSYVPAGDVTLILSWTFAAYGKDLFGFGSRLWDTVRVSVEEPTGDDADALSALLSARRQMYEMRSSFVDRDHWREYKASVHWDVYQMFPRTPYAEQALKLVVMGLYSFGANPPPGLSYQEVVKSYVLGFPEKPYAATLVTSVLRGNDDSFRRELFRAIEDSIPNSHVAKHVKELQALLNTSQGHK